MDMLDRMRKLALEKGIVNNLQLSKYTGVPYTTIDNFYKVGFENAKFNNSALVYNTANGGNHAKNIPSISNVYISVASNSSKFVGVVYNPSFVTINNCIVVDGRAEHRHQQR